MKFFPLVGATVSGAMFSPDRMVAVTFALARKSLTVARLRLEGVECDAHRTRAADVPFR
jgi:hypothetical protein